MFYTFFMRGHYFVQDGFIYASLHFLLVFLKTHLFVLLCSMFVAYSVLNLMPSLENIYLTFP